MCWIFASVIRILSGWCCDHVSSFNYFAIGLTDELYEFCPGWWYCDLVLSFNYFAIVLTDESYECCPGWWYCHLVSSFNYFANVLTDESYEFWPGDAMTLSPVLGLFCCYLDFHKHSFLHRERPNLLLQQTLSYWILRSADDARNYLENIEWKR